MACREQVDKRKAYSQQTLTTTNLLQITNVLTISFFSHLLTSCHPSILRLFQRCFLCFFFPRLLHFPCISKTLDTANISQTAAIWRLLIISTLGKVIRTVRVTVLRGSRALKREVISVISRSIASRVTRVLVHVLHLRWFFLIIYLVSGITARSTAVTHILRIRRFD